MKSHPSWIAASAASRKYCRLEGEYDVEGRGMRSIVSSGEKTGCILPYDSSL